MFGLFKKGDNSNNKSLKAVSPEGEQISKPISGSVQGKLRHSLELMAYTLENGLNKNQHIITFVATVDPKKEEKGSSGIETMDCAFIRASDESIGDMLMQVGMKDDTFAKAIIAVSQALQFHKPSLRQYAKGLMDTVKEGQRNGDIPKESPYAKEKRKGLAIDDFGKAMKGISLDELSKASDEEIDKLIENLVKKTKDDREED